MTFRTSLKNMTFRTSKSCEGACNVDGSTSPEEEIISAKTKTPVSIWMVQMRRQLKCFLTSFSGEERKALTNKIKPIGGILYESSVRILYFIVKYDSSNPD